MRNEAKRPLGKSSIERPNKLAPDPDFCVGASRRYLGSFIRGVLIVWLACLGLGMVMGCWGTPAHSFLNAEDERITKKDNVVIVYGTYLYFPYSRKAVTFPSGHRIINTGEKDITINMKECFMKLEDGTTVYPRRSKEITIKPKTGITVSPDFYLTEQQNMTLDAVKYFDLVFIVKTVEKHEFVRFKARYNDNYKFWWLSSEIIKKHNRASDKFCLLIYSRIAEKFPGFIQSQLEKNFGYCKFERNEKGSSCYEKLMKNEQALRLFREWWQENKDYLYLVILESGAAVFRIDKEAKENETPIDPKTRKPLTEEELKKWREEERELEKALKQQLEQKSQEE